jgi:hypothetical protein
MYLGAHLELCSSLTAVGVISFALLFRGMDGTNRVDDCQSDYGHFPKEVVLQELQGSEGSSLFVS